MSLGLGVGVAVAVAKNVGVRAGVGETASMNAGVRVDSGCNLLQATSITVKSKPLIVHIVFCMRYSPIAIELRSAFPFCSGWMFHGVISIQYTMVLRSEVPRFLWGATPLIPLLAFQDPHNRTDEAIRPAHGVGCRRSRDLYGAANG